MLLTFLNITLSFNPIYTTEYYLPLIGLVADLFRPIHSSCLSCVFSSFIAVPGGTHTQITSWLHNAAPSGGNILFLFLPEITLAVMITYLIGVIATELANNRAPKVLAIECWWAACIALLVIALLYCIQLLGPAYSAPVANNYLYVSKGLTASKLFVVLTSFFVLHLSENYIREQSRHVLEFSVIILLAILLLLVLVSANNLILVFFSLAGFSLNLYILILYDGADLASREASLKYFYLSTLSAGLILFGILLMYVMIGDVTYYTIRFYMSTDIDSKTSTVLSAAVLFILLGFFFKLSAFPGHLWAPEIYEGSPMPVMAFFVLPAKVAVFITFMRLLNTGLLDFSSIWLPCVTVAALGSLIWGAFAATQERKITRFLGYASINQIGFLLLGLVADTDDALRSAFFYLILYVIMTGGFLLVFTQLRKENGATFSAISDFRGLAKTENLVCWNLSVFLFSMAGIPPLAGFFGKYYLLASIMDKGLFIPVVVGLAVSLITAYYYLRIIKTFWFEEDIAVKTPVLLLSSAQRTVLSLLEASLWVAAIFAPWFLPMLTDVIATLAICADISVCDGVNISLCASSLYCLPGAPVTSLLLYIAFIFAHYFTRTAPNWLPSDVLLDTFLPFFLLMLSTLDLISRACFVVWPNENHFLYYPTPKSLNYNWSFGSLAGLFFALQLVTGIFLAMHYTPHVDWAFATVFLLPFWRIGRCRFAHSLPISNTSVVSQQPLLVSGITSKGAIDPATAFFVFFVLYVIDRRGRPYAPRPTAEENLASFASFREEQWAAAHAAPMELVNPNDTLREWRALEADSRQDFLLKFSQRYPDSKVSIPWQELQNSRDTFTRKGDAEFHANLYRANRRIVDDAPYPTFVVNGSDGLLTEEQSDAAINFTLASIASQCSAQQKLEATSFRKAAELAQRTIPNTDFGKRMSDAAVIAKNTEFPPVVPRKPGDINGGELAEARHNCRLLRVPLDEPRDRRHDLSLFEGFKGADLTSTSIDLFYCSKVIRVTGPVLYSTPSLLPLIFVYTWIGLQCFLHSYYGHFLIECLTSYYTYLSAKYSALTTSSTVRAVTGLVGLIIIDLLLLLVFFVLRWLLLGI